MMNLQENLWLSALVFGGLGYISGSLASALWITRLVKGVDVRNAGSRHASTTNTIRQAGWLAGAAVLVLDVLKGFLPVYAAISYGMPAWIQALIATSAVAGHCWPLFADFRGGMGLATAAGGLLAVSPLGTTIGLGVLISAVLVLHHGARGVIIGSILYVPLLLLLGQRGTIIWVAGGVVPILIFRFTRDWRRQYRELWLDRDM